MSIEDGDEILSEFLQESRESLQTAEPILIDIEQSVSSGGELDKESLDMVFRLFHSMKGVAGFLNLQNAMHVTHCAESLLDIFRAGKALPTANDISLIFSAMDFIGELLDEIEATASDEALTERGGEMSASLGEAVEAAIKRDLSNASDSVDQAVEAISPGTVAQVDVSEQVKDTKAAKEQNAAPPSGASPPPKPPPKKNEKDKGKTAGRAPSSPSSIRVETDKLDTLMNLVGELIIAETAVAHNPDLEGHDFESFNKSVLHLRRITRSLQDIAMAVRMVPISTTFRRMVRLVRDVSLSQEKQVDLVLVGETTEVDKTVVESINDPLVHILRNAVDHGLETPEERVAAGKGPKGRIELTACHQGGEVWIRITDDGRGLNRDKIMARGLERGLISASHAHEAKDSEVYGLIFEPGFSTADQVTDISGRGVGMDVVRRNIESLKGRVEVSSKPGHGTVVTLRIPLTLAIIEGMLVRVGETLYTIPLLSIRESIRPSPVDVTLLADGQQVVSIRNQLLSIVRLHNIHGIQPEHEKIEDGILVVVEDNGETLCLFVDEVIGQRQTVIKSLGDYLGNIRGLSGCSVLGNGDISLILDVGGVMEVSGVA